MPEWYTAVSLRLLRFERHMKKLLATIVCVAAGGAGWYYFRATEVPPNPEIVKADRLARAHHRNRSGDGHDRAASAASTWGPRYPAPSPPFTRTSIRWSRRASCWPKSIPPCTKCRSRSRKPAVERQKNDIETQELQLADIKRTRDRVQELYDKQLQPLQQLEAAELNVRTRESQVLSARKQLVQTEASLEAARLNLSYTKIYAPIDGVVVNRRVDRGQTVQASMTTPSFFMLTTPLQVLKLNAMVDEADVGRVRPGQTVKFRVNTFGQELFTGTVDAVRLNAFNSNSVVTYPVWVSVPNRRPAAETGHDGLGAHRGIGRDGSGAGAERRPAFPAHARDLPGLWEGRAGNRDRAQPWICRAIV